MTTWFETFRGVVYPAQCDAMGHLNIQHYVGFFDQAEWHCFLRLGFDPKVIARDRIGLADARHVIEYRRELQAGDLVRIESAVTRVGTSSLATAHNLYDAADRALCATLEAVSVQYDLTTRKARPLLPSLRAAALAALA